MTNRTWRRNVVCYSLVIACGVAPMAAASDPAEGSKPATAAVAPALVTQPAVDAALQAKDPAIASWQAEIAAAKAKRSSARKQQYVGWGVSVAGYVMMVNGAYRHDECGYYGGSCSSSSGLAWAGLATMVIGTTAGIMGSIKAHDADGEVNAIIARGPQRTIAISLGQEKSVGYRISW